MGGSHFFHALVLLILIELATYINPCSSETRPISTEKSTNFIKTSCDATTYPELCFSSLSGYASEIQASPKLLASTALSVTLKSARSTSSTMAKLSKSQGQRPREAAALLDCVEELSDSVEELERSIGEMGDADGKSFGFQMNDIQTWVSSALTDENTCMDGFAGKAMNGNVKTTMRGLVVNIAHMTSNALALINNYAATQGL